MNVQWSILLVVLLQSLAGFPQQSVIIHATTTTAYCKGCSPDPVEYQKLTNPSMYAGDIYLYCIDSIQFGAEWVAQNARTMLLHTGTYIAAFEPMTIGGLQFYLNNKTPGLAWLKPNIYVIEIKSDTHELSINHHHYCSWSLNPNEQIPN
jgi:hypothetical protein